MFLHLLLLLFGQPLVGRWAMEPGRGGMQGGGGAGESAPAAGEGAGQPASPVPWTSALGVVDVDLEPRQIAIAPFPFPAKATPPAEEVETTPRSEPTPEPEPVTEVAETEHAPDAIPAGGGGIAGDGSGPSGDARGAGGAGDGGGTGGSGSGDGSGGGASDNIGGNSPPTIQAMTLPDFPKSAKKKSRVPIVLSVHVTAAGAVDQVRVERGSADCPECDAAAIASAWKLRFTPGTQGGVPVAMWVRYPVTFGRQ